MILRSLYDYYTELPNSELKESHSIIRYILCHSTDIDIAYKAYGDGELQEEDYIVRLLVLKMILSGCFYPEPDYQPPDTLKGTLLYLIESQVHPLTIWMLEGSNYVHLPIVMQTCLLAKKFVPDFAKCLSDYLVSRQDAYQAIASQIDTYLSFDAQVDDDEKRWRLILPTLPLNCDFWQQGIFLRYLAHPVRSIRLALLQAMESHLMELPERGLICQGLTYLTQDPSLQISDKASQLIQQIMLSNQIRRNQGGK